MTLSDKALTTARRNLVQRIERYLTELEKRDAAIGQREGNHLVRALGHLEAGTYAEGERDVMWAEWASRQPGNAEPHPAATREALQEQLVMAVAEGQLGCLAFRSQHSKFATIGHLDTAPKIAVITQS